MTGKPGQDADDAGTSLRRTRGIAVYASQFGIPEDEVVSLMSHRFGRRMTEEALHSSGGSAWVDADGLSLRDRSLIVIAALTALGGVEERLRPHVGWAIDHGVTPSEMEAAVTLLANYTGYPRASTAMEIVREELSSRDLLDS